MISFEVTDDGKLEFAHYLPGDITGVRKVKELITDDLIKNSPYLADWNTEDREFVYHYCTVFSYQQILELLDNLVETHEVKIYVKGTKIDIVAFDEYSLITEYNLKPLKEVSKEDIYNCIKKYKGEIHPAIKPYACSYMNRAVIDLSRSGPVEPKIENDILIMYDIDPHSGEICGEYRYKIYDLIEKWGIVIVDPNSEYRRNI